MLMDVSIAEFCVFEKQVSLLYVSTANAITIL